MLSHTPSMKRPAPKFLGAVALLSLGSLLPAACRSSEDGDGSSDDTGGQAAGESSHAPCTTDAECTGTEICVGAICLLSKACTDSRDCDFPMVCGNAGGCVECVTDAECSGDESCYGSRCTVPCTSDQQCVLDGRLCDTEAGFCVACINSEHCPEGQTCIDRACVAPTQPGGAGSGGDTDGDGSIGGPCGALTLPMTVRDFTEAQSDFAVSCGTLETGALLADLDGDEKPVLRAPSDAACISSPDSFHNWYRDTPGENATGTYSLVLWDDGTGGLVNRYGENGESWVAQDNAKYDGNPVFFPADDLPGALDSEYYGAVIPPRYGYDSWPPESDVVEGARDHNFYFTTELEFRFTYRPTETSRLMIAGDDDIWVFVNGILALDLGGVHEPAEGTVMLDSATAPEYGLMAGERYKAKIFHAKRKREASTYHLQLNGFGLEPVACE